VFEPTSGEYDSYAVSVNSAIEANSLPKTSGRVRIYYIRIPSQLPEPDLHAIRRSRLGPLDLIKVTALMDITRGRREVTIGLLDGPVALDHASLIRTSIRQLATNGSSTCSEPSTAACSHGTFVAGILSARRDSDTPGICPDCTLLVRPIFHEKALGLEAVPSITPLELAAAIIDSVEAGAQILNISSVMRQLSTRSDRDLEASLDYAARHGVIVIVAAGNQGMIGSTPLTRHPWVIPVVGYELSGRPMDQTNLGHSLGRRGIGAPGQVTSINIEGQQPLVQWGTSFAAPLVTGTIALLWSLFPTATATEVKLAVGSQHARPATLAPPLLDAWAAYERLSTALTRR
jgi:subtilisin family serine protease